MRFNFMAQTGRNLDRVREVVAVLAKYGLADWLDGLDAPWARALLRRAGGKRFAGVTTAARIRMALAELGTTFIKLGQILSTRPDLVGADIAAELSKLQTAAPADSPEQVRRTITEELGRPPEEIYREFEAEPFASASIAQVHRARLVSGERVVVKVQHAGITERIHSDLDILRRLAELAEKYSTQLRLYQPRTAVTQLRDTLLRELDFRQEQRNLDRFNRNFAREPKVRFPRGMADYSSARVLTMELMEGTTGFDLDRLRTEGIDPAEVARAGANAYLEMVFRDGFYHADPHPGNFMILPDGVLVILDGGMVGRLDPETRGEIEAILMALVSKDAAALSEAVVRVGSLPPDFDRHALRADMAEFLADYAELSLEELDLSAALGRVTEIIRSHRILLPASISLLLRLFIMLDGTGRLLDPAFRLAEVLRPYYLKVLQRRLSPRQLLRDLRRVYRDWSRLAEAFPRDLGEVLRRISSGAFEVKMEHRRLERTVNRLVKGVLTAALLVTSGMMWAQKAEPTVWDISIVGAGCFTLALFLGYRLLASIWSSDEES